MQIMAFPTARRLAAAMARMHNGAEASKGTWAGALTEMGPGNVGGALGGHRALNFDAAAAGGAPAPATPQDAASASPSMPVLVLPGPSAKDLPGDAGPSGAAYSPLKPPQPPSSALGGVVLQGGCVTAVRQGAAACGRSCDPAAAAAASFSASPGVEHAQPPAHVPHQQQPPSARGSTARAAAALAAKGEPAKDGQADRKTIGLAAGMRPLRCAWRVRLSECVDATPIIVAQPRMHGRRGYLHPTSNPTRVPEKDPGWGCYALGCSHGGDVVCVEGTGGALVWRARLPGRADAGLAVTADMQARSKERAFACNVACEQRRHPIAVDCCQMRFMLCKICLAVHSTCLTYAFRRKRSLSLPWQCCQVSLLV